MNGVDKKRIEKLLNWYMKAPSELKEDIIMLYGNMFDFIKAIEHFKDMRGDDYDGMKIMRVTESEIVFSNGNKITYDHDQDCCEANYADFTTLNRNNIHYNHLFKKDLEFKFVEGEGFLFGDEKARIFIPCYSEQNGYYTTNIDIYYNGEKVLSGLCREIIC